MYLCGKLNHVDGLKQGTGDIMDQLHIAHTTVLKLHPTNTTFTLSGMTTVELSSIYSHSSSRLLLSACSSSPSATTTTSSSPQHHLSRHCHHLQPASLLALYGDCSSHRVHGSCSNWCRRGVLYDSRMPRCCTSFPPHYIGS